MDTKPRQPCLVLDRAIPYPEKTLIIGHSLGVMTAINWMSHVIESRKRAYFPIYFPGLVSVAGNINDVGFDEITHNFSEFSNYTWRHELLWQRIGRLMLIYGKHDPWVDAMHGYKLASMLGHPDAPILEMLQEAHFSGEHTTEQGQKIPPCTSIPLLNKLASSIIYEASSYRRQLVEVPLSNSTYKYQVVDTSRRDSWLKVNSLVEVG